MDLLGVRCGINRLFTVLPNGPVSNLVLPSSWVNVIARDYPREFRLHFGADARRLKPFWEEFLGRPRTGAFAARHPFLKDKTAADLAHTVPCSVHTDAGPFSKKLSCTCVSFGSLLSQGQEKVTRFLVYSNVKKTPSEGDDLAWTTLVKDFDALAAGGPLAPRTSDGTVWRFVWLFLKNDEESRCNEFGFAHYSATEPCSECMANDSNRPYTDLRASALWRSTEPMPLPCYFARVREPLHAFLRSHYWCDRWVCSLDLMHVMDCKGVAALVYGGLLGLLVRKWALGPNQAARLAHVNVLRANWYAVHPGVARMPKILMSNLTTEGWGDLSSPVIKAAMTRQAAPWFLDLANRFFTTASPTDTAVRTCLGALVRFYDTLYSANRFLTNDEVNALRRACLDFGVAYMRLRDIARTEGLLLWPVRPKVHKMQHFPLLSEVMNPRFIQNYIEESLVGTTTTVWKRSVKGRYEEHVQRVVLMKRVVGVLLRFEM